MEVSPWGPSVGVGAEFTPLWLRADYFTQCEMQRQGLAEAPWTLTQGMVGVL